MKKRKKSKKNINPVSFLIFVLVMLIGVVSFQVYELYEKNSELNEEALKIEMQINKEKSNQKSLLEYKEYVNTKEYIEKLARDKFGLIKPGEVLFITEE